MAASPASSTAVDKNEPVSAGHSTENNQETVTHELRNGKDGCIVANHLSFPDFLALLARKLSRYKIVTFFKLKSNNNSEGEERVIVRADDVNRESERVL